MVSKFVQNEAQQNEKYDKNQENRRISGGQKNPSQKDNLNNKPKFSNNQLSDHNVESEENYFNGGSKNKNNGNMINYSARVAL